MRVSTLSLERNGIPDILDEAMWGVMLWTNLQYTPNEPSGAVAWGS